MKLPVRTLSVLSFGALQLGCAAARPPPQTCEPPPAIEKKIVVGSCTLDSPSPPATKDAGEDA